MADKTTRRAKCCLGSEITEMFKGHRTFRHVQDTLRPSAFLEEARVQQVDVLHRYGRHPGLVIIRSPEDREESSGINANTYVTSVLWLEKYRVAEL